MAAVTSATPDASNRLVRIPAMKLDAWLSSAPNTATASAPPT